MASLSMDGTFSCSICGESNFLEREGFYYCVECGAQFKDLRHVTVENEEFDNKHKKTLKIKEIGSEKPELTSWECYNYILRGLVEELLSLGAKKELKIKVLQIWTAYLRHHEVAFFSRNKQQLPKLGVRYFERDAKIIFNHEMRRKHAKRKSKFQSKSPGKRASNRQRRKFAESEYENTSVSQFESTQSTIHSTSISQISSSSNSTARPVRLKFTNIARKQFKRIMPLSHLKRHEEDANKSMNCHNMKLKLSLVKYNHLNDHLNRKTIYTILYLALNLIDDDIQLSDMLRFLQEGHLSSSNISHFFPENITDACLDVVKSINYFHGRHIFFDSCIRKNSAIFCRSINLCAAKTPNILKLISRYVYDLNLPDECTTYLQRLLKRYPPKFETQFTMNGTPCFEGRAMAYIVFFMKLIFGLDGHKETIISESMKRNNKILKSFGCSHRDIFVWKDWVRYINMRSKIITKCHQPISVIAQEYDWTTHTEYKRTNLLNIERIFEAFQSTSNLNNMNVSNKYKFPPTLTPKRSYFDIILQGNDSHLYIPEFMHERFSDQQILPFLDPEDFEKQFDSQKIQIIIEKVPCGEISFQPYVFKNFSVLQRLDYNEKVVVKEVDSDISEDDWLEKISQCKWGSFQANKFFLKKINVKGIHGEYNFANCKSVTNRGDSYVSSIGTDVEKIPRNKEIEKFLNLKFSNLDYWILLGKSSELTELQRNKLRNQLPAVFSWLLNICSEMIGINWDVLYHEVLVVEVAFLYMLEPFEKRRKNDVRTEHPFNGIANMLEYFKSMW